MKLLVLRAVEGLLAPATELGKGGGSATGRGLSWSAASLPGPWRVMSPLVGVSGGGGGSLPPMPMGGVASSLVRSHRPRWFAPALERRGNPFKDNGQ